MPDSFRDLQSFYKTTLTQSIGAADVTIPVSTAPAVTTAYLIFEPNTVNEEISLMTGVSGNNLTVVRGLASSGSSEAAGTGMAHPAGSAVIMADAHYYIKHLQVSKAFEYRGSYANSTAINAIANAMTGDLALNLNDGLVYYYNGSSWVVSASVSATSPATNSSNGTIKTDQGNNSLPRTLNVYVQAQASPNLTLKVLPFDFWNTDKIVSFAGGNTPGFISPTLQGTFALPSQPANGDTWTLTINGTAVSGIFVSAIGVTAGNVLIGADAAHTQANFLGLLQSPGTTNTTQVALSGGNQTLINYLGYTSSTTNIIAQGLNNTAITTLTGATNTSGNSFAVNTNPRIDLVVYDIATTSIKLIQGTTAASPTVPSVSNQQIVLAEVKLVAGMSSIKENDDSTNGFIYKWPTIGLYRNDLEMQIVLTDTGSVNALAITPSPAYTSYFLGMTFKVSVANTNTGATTINANSLGTKTIKRLDGTDLKAGDIVTGEVILIVYNGTTFQLINQVVGYQAFVFTSTGTFVAPKGVTSVLVDIVGGGGGAGGNQGANTLGGGGGGGGASGATNVTSSVTALNSYAVVIGAGGLAGTGTGGGGQGGGVSSFNGISKGGGGGGSSTASNTGGAGGVAGDASAGAGGAGGSSGGAGTAGSAGTGGGSGGAAASGGTANGGGGGASGLGLNGGAGSTAVGSVGAGFGGGGGGGGNQNQGGVGAPGLVIIKVPINQIV